MVGALMFVALMPPRQGAMLLISITGQPAGRIFETVRASGARIVGNGPIGSSVVIFGDRAAIAARALRSGIVPVGTTSPTCARPGGKKTI